jgi:tRNA(Arg) A34 adenosine deaminase TadA
MCAAAVSLARVKAHRFGAEDTKGGGVIHGPRIFAQPTCHHRPDVLGGIGEAEAAELLRGFFEERR